MKEITLDFTGCKNIMRLHEILAEAFHFPEWYGQNLDALWDLLRDYSGGPPVLVKIKGIETMPYDLRGYMNEVLKVFSDLREEVPEMHFELI